MLNRLPSAPPGGRPGGQHRRPVWPRRGYGFARRVLVAGGGAVSVLVSSTATAPADGWGTADCGQVPTPQCQLEVGQGSNSPRPQGHGPTDGDELTGGDSGDSAGGENLANCGYRPSGYEPPVGAVGSGLLPSGAWYDGLCSTTGLITNPVQVLSLAPVEVARLARNQLGLPTPHIAASPATDQLVNLPTWLWLDGGWEPVSATVSVPGVSVTATAEPRAVSWSMGDGGSARCVGPGTPFRAGTDPRAASPDCGYTYRRSSAAQPGQGFPVSATVHWSVSWSGAGQSGTFPDLTTTSATSFRVAESQALTVTTAPR